MGSNYISRFYGAFVLCLLLVSLASAVEQMPESLLREIAREHPDQKLHEGGAYSEAGTFVHLVRPEETVERICRMYRVDLLTMLRINGIVVSSEVRPGVELLIPPSDS